MKLPNSLLNTSMANTGRAQKSIKRGAGKRRVDGKSFRLADEVRYITRRAAHHDGRIVTIGQLTLFSSETGDAWMIDRDDHLALQLVRQGDPEPFHIEETHSSFAMTGRVTIASKAQPSSTPIAIPAVSQPFSATRPTSSRRKSDPQISNMFG